MFVYCEAFCINYPIKSSQQVCVICSLLVRKWRLREAGCLTPNHSYQQVQDQQRLSGGLAPELPIKLLAPLPPTQKPQPPSQFIWQSSKLLPPTDQIEADFAPCATDTVLGYSLLQNCLSNSRHGPSLFPYLLPDNSGTHNSVFKKPSLMKVVRKRSTRLASKPCTASVSLTFVSLQVGHRGPPCTVMYQPP